MYLSFAMHATSCAIKWLYDLLTIIIFFGGIRSGLFLWDQYQVRDERGSPGILDP